MNLHFEKVNLTHKEIIFSWLEEFHIKEFWDNSQGHRMISQTLLMAENSIIFMEQLITDLVL